MKSLGLASSIGGSGRLSAEDNTDEDEASKMAIASYQAREEEIEKRKMEVRKRVESQITRAEQETRRLTQVWEELEVLNDPMRKDVVTVRKRLDMANRDLKSLAHLYQKKEEEYKEAMEAFQEKSKEKAELTTALIQLVNQSESFRMKKLEDLSNIVNSKS